MSPFWLTFFLWVGFTVLGELLRPKPKFGAPAPSGIGDFAVPTAEAGRPIPAICGTVKMRGPNVVWYGGLSAVAQKKKVKTGLFSSTQVTTGYRYYLTEQLVLCHGPLDDLIEIRFDDRAVPFTFAADAVRPREPSQGGWGVSVLVASPADATDDTNPDGDYGYMQGAESTTGAVIGYRENFGSPFSNELTGWKLHVVPKRIGSGNVPDDTLEVYSATTWSGTTYPTAAFISGNLVVATATPWISNQLTGVYQDFVLEFTPAQAQQMRDQGSISILRKSNGFSGSGSAVQRDTQVWLEVPGHISNEPAVVKIDAPAQFGGDDREGGVQGLIEMYLGSQTQPPSAALQTAVGVASLPAYLGIAYVVLKGGPQTIRILGGRSLIRTTPGFYVGTTPYLKAIAFVLRKCPNGLGLTGGKHNIDGDSNPACWVYEILTDTLWGCGIPPSLIDLQSFTEAGETLFAEGLGVSMIFDQQSQASELVSEVLRHVDGIVFPDPATNKLRMKLARPDYQVMDLLRLDKASVNNVKITVPSWDDTKNIVKIRYIDRAQNFTERVAQAQDLANVQARDGEKSEEEFAFRGFSSAAAAQRAAARVLRTVTFPLKVLELECNRLAWALRPGDVFRLTWEPLGISDMACRVTRIRIGDPRDGRIMVDAVEDIFGIAWTAYSDPSASEWADPLGAVGALEDAKLIEVPYAMVVGSNRLAMALAATGTPLATGIQVWSDVGGTDYALTNEGQVTPYGVLADAPGGGGMGYTDTTIRVAPGIIMPQAPPEAAEFAQGGAVLLIDNELIAWQFMEIGADGVYTFLGLVRGVMDTTPVSHVPGSPVWFISEGGVLVRNEPYEADDTVNAHLIPYNSFGVAASGIESSVVLASRAQRTYLPTDFRINGLAYPSLITGALALTWSHRNRLDNWTFEDAGVTASPEAGTTYTIRLYGDDDTLLRTYSGLTGTSQTWTTEAADSPGGVLNTRVRIELEAVRSSQVSHQMINFTVWRTIAENSILLDVVNRVGRMKKRRGAILIGDGGGDPGGVGLPGDGGGGFTIRR